MDIETIKAANRIEEIIAEELTITGHGRYRKTATHDSLVIDTVDQTYFWNSRGEQGDVIDWLQRRRGWDFKEAVEYLCRRAHLEPPTWSREESQRAVARRTAEDIMTIAARYFVRCLWASEEGLAYARGRGWTDETIKQAGLGYSDGNVQGLRDELRMHGVDLNSTAARAVLGIPARMLIYPHVRTKRVRYLSARSIEGKRHYNLRSDLVGERRPFFNHVYSIAAEDVVVCEGQADAITWGQWGVAAVALAGCTADVALVRRLEAHQVYLALDTNAAGETGSHKMADLLGPLCRILPAWPDGVTDANEALQAGMNAETVLELLAKAPTWVELQATRAGVATGADREIALRDLFALIRRLDEFQISVMRRNLTKLANIGLREFNNLLKASVSVEEDNEGLTISTPMIGGFINDHLFETIYIPEEEKTRFAVRYPDGKIAIVDNLHLGGGRTIVPISPFHPALKKSVLLPDGLGQYDGVKALHREVAAFIHRYLDIDTFYENLAAYYVLFSWMYDSFQVLPYLRALGDYGTGKTRFLKTIGSICYRPIFAAGATTTSPIFRMLSEFRGTLVLDEADFVNSDAEADIVKILNIGYSTDFDVQRTGKTADGQFSVEFYEVFGPKVIATRRRFKDRALESRCLTKEMGGLLPRSDIPIVLPLSFRDEARKLRNKLLRYRLEHWKPALEVTNDDMDRTIEPRLNQVTMALKKLVGDPELVEEINQFIREHQRQTIIERSMTLAAKVLQAIIELGNEPLGLDEQGQPIYDLTLANVTQRVNTILDTENESPDGEDSDGDDQRRPAVKPRRVGHIVRNELQLRTERDRSVRGKGRYAVIWDDERITALATRFGLEELLKTPQPLERESSASADDSNEDRLNF